MSDLEQLIDQMMCDALGLEGMYRQQALDLVQEQRAAARPAE